MTNLQGEEAKINHMFFIARIEHAFLMRCEGETYKSIGDRLGVSRECARDLIFYFAKVINRKTRKTRWRIVGSPD
jgi:DNA-directed RNA polymerase subunit N (RpoN/RPB10)